MDKILSLLSENNYIKLEAPLDVRNVIGAQKELTRHGVPILPEGFIKFLRCYNGLSCQDSCVLGIPPVNNSRLDIVEFNEEFNNSSDMVILGYDDFGYLVYNSSTKTYQLIDKDGGLVIEEFMEDELEYALISIIHINYE